MTESMGKIYDRNGKSNSTQPMPGDDSPTSAALLPPPRGISRVGSSYRNSATQPR